MTDALYAPERKRPTALALVILVHGAALAGVLLNRMEVPVPPVFKPTTIIDVDPDPIPDPAPPKAKQEPVRKTKIYVPTPPIPLPTDADPVETTTTEKAASDPGPIRTEPEADPVPIPDPPAPIRRAARIDPGSDLKPPYPSSEQRLGSEGSVTVRVAIGSDGRVREVVRIRAASDAFFEATRRHALRAWRFRPATLDGRPVESSAVMTIHFRLDDLG